MEIFLGNHFSSFTREKYSRFLQDLRRIPLSDSNFIQFEKAATELLHSYKIESLRVDFSEVSTDIVQKTITRGRAEHQFDIAQYYFGFSGDFGLLQFKPSSWSTNVYIVEPLDGELCFETIATRKSRDDINGEFENFKRYFESSISLMNEEIASYNNDLKNAFDETLRAKKDEIEKRAQLNKDLGYPQRRK